MSKGFIPIRRTLFGHFLFKEARVFSRFEAWLDLIQLASFTESQTEMVNGKTIARSRGEVISPIRWLCDRWTWSRHKTTRFIDLLRTENMVFAVTENGVTKLSLINFDKYNSTSDKPSETRAGGSWTSNRAKSAQSPHQKGDSKGDSKGDTSTPGTIEFPQEAGTAKGTAKGTKFSQQGDAEGTLRGRIYMNKKENKENKGEKELSEYQEPTYWERQRTTFLTNLVFFETFCISKKLGAPAARALQERFLDDLVLKDDMKDARELQRHFTNWFNKGQIDGLIDLQGNMKTPPAIEQSKIPTLSAIEQRTNRILDEIG